MYFIPKSYRRYSITYILILICLNYVIQTKTVPLKSNHDKSDGLHSDKCHLIPKPDQVGVVCFKF